jgi:formylglycine-generating enzyme required for sulfatase activity
MNFEIAPKSTEVQLNWEDAVAYCDSLNIDGESGWRLPMIDELNEIYQSNNDFNKDWYWSSTEGLDGYAWNQVFSNGSEDNFTKSGLNFVRAIRDLKDN